MLTGKCKEDFEKWIITDFVRDNLDPNDTLSNPSFDSKLFYSMPFSMQWGVYLSWLDSLDYYMILTKEPHGFWSWVILHNEFVVEWSEQTDDIKTRQEAQQAAIQKANEIYNTLPTEGQ